MNIKNRKGFTLIELIIVIVLLGLLAAAALPKFSDLETQARSASQDGVIGGFRSAVNIVHGDWLAKGKGTTILTLEDARIAVHDDYGWPENGTTSGSDPATANKTMTAAKCLAVYNSILSGPPEADTTCTSSSCEVKVTLKTGSTTICVYTFEQGTGQAFEYTISNGKVEKL